MSAYFVEKETVDGAIGALLHSGFFMSLEQATSLGQSGCRAVEVCQPHGYPADAQFSGAGWHSKQL